MSRQRVSPDAGLEGTPKRGSSASGVDHGAADEGRAPTLQDWLGNRAVGRLLAASRPGSADRAHGVVQPKLKVGATDDPFERDADSFADNVGCGCSTGLGSPCAQCLGTVPELVLRRKSVDPNAAPSSDIADGLDLGPGRPIDLAQREFFESRVGEDLGSVRIHTDDPAERAAEGMGARAFTIGRDIAFGLNEYRPNTTDGQRLLAHEIAHVLQQRAADSGVLRRQPKPGVSAWDRYSHSGPVDWKAGMRATLVSDIDDKDSVDPDLRGIKSGSLVEVVSLGFPGTGAIEVRLIGPKARLKRSWWFNSGRLEPVGAPVATPVAGSSGGTYSVPVDVQYELLGRLGDEPGSAAGFGVCRPEPDSSFGFGPAALRSPAIGLARGFGFMISPPVRGPLDPWLPLASRLGGPAPPLRLTGDSVVLDRYLTSPARELTPRYASEAGELILRESFGESWWLNNFELTERQLRELPGLVTQIATEGMESLAPAEQEIVMNFLRAHAESVAPPGVKIASPAISTTAREGLSAVPEAAPLFREAPYVVRIQVPADAVLDVNAAMGADRMPGLVYEQEVLVFTDARGAITRVMPNPASTFGRFGAPALRWGGRGLLVFGAWMTYNRIKNATPEELPRVVGEEGGGWAGGFGGASLGAAACIAFGIATEGVGLLLCGALGGIGGGLLGSYLGGEAGQAFGDALGGIGGGGGGGPMPQDLEERKVQQLVRKSGGTMPPGVQNAVRKLGVGLLLVDPNQ